LTDKENDILLTEEEVYQVVEFAKFYGLNYPGMMSSSLLNQRMQDVSMNPVAATEATLDAALKSPKDSEEQLQEFSQNFEITSQPYKRLLSYLGNTLAFDYTYSCINIKKTSDYKKPSYNEDLDVLKKFMDRFDYKSEFTTVVKQLLRNEAFFCSPRFNLNSKEEEKYILQEFPSRPRYTMITGRWAHGFLFSLNMYWFLQSGVDINLYDPFFKEKYNQIYDGQGNLKRYNPAASPLTRGTSSYMYWQDIPVDIGWCWKFDPAVVTRVPYFSGLFLDLVQQPLMRALQKSINMSTASRIIIGQVGTLKDTGTKQKDQFNINPRVLGEFLAVVKAAIGEAAKVAAVPLEEVQGVEFKSENEMYNSYLKTALGSSGVNSNLIFSSNLKMNTIEIQLSLNNDEQLMEGLYPEFNSFINYQVNRKTKKYKFSVKFEGTQFFNNRNERFEKVTKLAEMGVVLPQKMAAANGMSPFELQRQMEEAKAQGFVDNLTPILSVEQGVGNDKGGRPRKKANELGEEGSENRATGANIQQGGKI